MWHSTGTARVCHRYRLSSPHLEQHNLSINQSIYLSILEKKLFQVTFYYYDWNVIICTVKLWWVLLIEFIKESLVLCRHIIVLSFHNLPQWRQIMLFYSFMVLNIKRLVVDWYHFLDGFDFEFYGFMHQDIIKNHLVLSIRPAKDQMISY